MRAICIQRVGNQKMGRKLSAYFYQCPLKNFEGGGADLMFKLSNPRGQVCHDRSNLYRKANSTEVELGYCNKTVNPHWDPDDWYRKDEIPAVKWHFCKKAQMCIEISNR